MDRLEGDRFVPSRKIAGYLLNHAHPIGAAKARFFECFGFAVDLPDVLIDAISQHPDDNRLVSTHEDAFGTKSIVECHLRTPDGRDPCVRTVWLRESDTVVHRFITAYPVKPE